MDLAVRKSALVCRAIHWSVVKGTGCAPVNPATREHPAKINVTQDFMELAAKVNAPASKAYYVTTPMGSVSSNVHRDTTGKTATKNAPQGHTG